MLVCFDNGARTLPAIERAGRFGVNVLAAGQEAIARRFASSEAPENEKFAGVAHALHEGIPVLEGGLAWVGCELRELLPGGDHTIGIGAVQAAETAREDDDREPLVWYRATYGAFAP